MADEPRVNWQLIAETETPRCGESVTHAGNPWFPCALPEGHDGGHRGRGYCFKHGLYLGEVGKMPECPEWPCFQEPAQPRKEEVMPNEGGRSPNSTQSAVTGADRAVNESDGKAAWIHAAAKRIDDLSKSGVWGLQENSAQIIYEESAALRKVTVELDNFKTWGSVEIAVRNPQVAEYCKHWEGRAKAAEEKVRDWSTLLKQCIKYVPNMLKVRIERALAEAQKGE